MTFLKTIVGILYLTFLSSSASAQITWSCPVLFADSGSTVSANLTVSGYQSLISAQGTIYFDSSVLEYSHVDNFALSSMSTSSFGETEVDSGLLSFLWFESDLIGRSIPDNDVVFRITFNVIGNPGDNSIIELTSQSAVVEFVDESFNEISFNHSPGSITVNNVANLSEIAEKEFTVFPNPASAWIRVEGNSMGKELQVTWHSMEGKLVKKDFFSGQNIKLSTDELEPGSYIMRIGNENTGFDMRQIQIL